MREPRNPFKFLNAERILSEETFLQLFAPGVLDLLPEYDAWDLILPIRSTPGGGKTTLFRLLTPDSLSTIYENRSYIEYKEIFNKLKSIGAISEEGINLLGIYLSCDHDYDILNDMNYNETLKTSLFFTLLNCRILYSALKGIISINDLNFPDDIDKIIFYNTSNIIMPIDINFPCSGYELLQKIRSIELNILNAVDSFIPTKLPQIIASNSLFCINLLKSNSITINKNFFTKKILILLDDVHKLTRSQREMIFNSINDIRLPIGIWISERLQALKSDEILFEGLLINREFASEISLEKEWKKNPKKYELLLTEIANRRTKIAYDSNIIQINNFQSCIENNLDSAKWLNSYKNIIDVINDRIKKNVNANKRFKKWHEYVMQKNNTTREKSIELRMLEILMEREPQKTLFEEPIPISKLIDKMNTNIKNSAEYLLSQEFDLPYYFGMDKMIKLSSYNIEQFLLIAGESFEEAISSAWLEEPTSVSASRQEEIVLETAKLYWDSLPQIIPNASDVQSFILHIKDFCLNENAKPTFPYIPGVTGIGIRTRELPLLTNTTNSNYVKLANIITSCVANNLLEPSHNYRQGKRGQTWLILYLNRHLCSFFGLPLGYGGWRPRRVRNLLHYLRMEKKLEEKELEKVQT